MSKPSKSLAELAVDLGVGPVEPADDLAGPPVPDEEWAPFEAAIRECRGEQACGFHAHNPASGKLARCVSPAEVTVIVAATTPGGAFRGNGVETAVCTAHGRQLVNEYDAIAVPAEAGDAP